MNRRGLMKMIGLAPMVPVAAAVPVGGVLRRLPARYIAGSALVLDTAPLVEAIESECANVAAVMTDAEKEIMRLQITQLYRDDEMAMRFSIPVTDAQIIETHYWGA